MFLIFCSNMLYPPYCIRRGSDMRNTFSTKMHYMLRRSLSKYVESVAVTGSGSTAVHIAAVSALLAGVPTLVVAQNDRDLAAIGASVASEIQNLAECIGAQLHVKAARSRCRFTKSVTDITPADLIFYTSPSFNSHTSPSFSELPVLSAHAHPSAIFALTSVDRHTIGSITAAGLPTPRQIRSVGFRIVSPFRALPSPAATSTDHTPSSDPNHAAASAFDAIVSPSGLVRGSIELTSTAVTSPHVAAAARAFAERSLWNVFASRDVPGGVANSATVAAILFAARLVDDGSCSAADIDALLAANTAASFGADAFGTSIPPGAMDAAVAECVEGGAAGSHAQPIGPLRLADAIGLDRVRDAAIAMAARGETASHVYSVPQVCWTIPCFLSHRVWITIDMSHG